MSLIDKIQFLKTILPKLVNVFEVIIRVLQVLIESEVK